MNSPLPSNVNTATLPLSQVHDYAENLLAQRISMVNGVAQVNIFGPQQFAVRVQVDPNKLAAHGLGIDQVAASIESQFADKLKHSNIEAERSALKTFAAQLTNLGESYSEVTRHEQQVIASVHESSATLTSMFMDALASIQFQDVTRQQVEQVNSALDRLGSHAKMLADRLERFDDPNLKITPLTQHLDEIYGSYVMSSQRKSHDQALNTRHTGRDIAGPTV